MKVWAAFLVFLGAYGCADEAVVLPSGIEVTLEEVLVEPQGHSGEAWMIVRVLAPAIGAGDRGAEEIATDMDRLCEIYGLPAAAGAEVPPAQIVVQLMDRVVPRGESAPEATQFFAGYRYENNACIWEVF